MIRIKRSLLNIRVQGRAEKLFRSNRRSGHESSFTIQKNRQMETGISEICRGML